MDKALIEALARQAGLARALEAFPQCVAAAAAQVLLLVAALVLQGQ